MKNVTKKIERITKILERLANEKDASPRFRTAVDVFCDTLSEYRPGLRALTPKQIGEMKDRLWYSYDYTFAVHGVEFVEFSNLLALEIYDAVEDGIFAFIDKIDDYDVYDEWYYFLEDFAYTEFSAVFQNMFFNTDDVCRFEDDGEIGFEFGVEEWLWEFVTFCAPPLIKNKLY